MLSFLTSKYILILFWIGFVALLAKYVPLTKKETVIGYDGEVERYYWLFAFIAFLPVIIMAANRSWYIGDTFAYRISFEKMPDAVDGLHDYLAKNTKDVGFYYLSAIFKIFISNDPRVYFWVIACIQGSILIWFYRKYSPSYLMSFFLFVVSSDYLSWMFNGIRQFLAVTIVLLAVPFFLRKKYIRGIIIILFAATIHQTALMMLPIIFLVQGETWNKKTIVFTILVIAALVFLDQFTNLLEESLSNTQYKNVMNDIEEFGNKGTNFFRVLVYSVPALLSFIYRKSINADAPIFIKLSANMCVISSGLYIVSMFTSGVFMGRLPIYCSLFGYLFLPWISSKEFDGKTRQIIYFLMITLYLVYYYIQVHTTWKIF